ncbi:hypothetical protein [Mongoliitalea daihaiensis]|uniref:hypothetical protein n=1 Tax=Mongoliitalea daihaiensis TaxID=2782006 RepID=UPI001F26E65B|nr:hypothetical protein [Mongoliitalea daihaiensis]UJP65130.1 hypothetical protein IPZ59_00355 [Mongoliitalea daihaiensis]
MMNMERDSDGYLVQVEEITAEEFLENLYSLGEIYHLGSPDKIIRVKGVIRIDPARFKKECGIIENYEFTEIVYFKGEDNGNKIKLGKNLVLIDCKFTKGLHFLNCVSENFESKEEAYLGKESIQFINGVYDSLKIEESELSNGINFSGIEQKKLVIEWLDINNCHFINDGVSFEYTQLNRMFDFNFNKFNSGTIRFFNSEINSGFRASFNNGVGSLYSFGKDSIFKKEIFIYHGDYISIDFNDSKFYGKVSLVAVCIREELKIKGSTFHDCFSFESLDVTNNSKSKLQPSEIFLQDNQFQNGFRFDAEQMNVENLTIVFSEKSSGVMEFDNSFFNSVNLIGNNFNNSVFFRDSTYQVLSFINFFNRALVSFNNNVPNNSKADYSELKIENSNLGNTEFYDFDFSVYPIIRIIDSRVDNIYAFGVEWFKDSQLHVDDNETSPSKILSQKREIYRQLKLAAEKQSDKITSLFFKAREIQLHKDVIKSKKQTGVHQRFQKLSDLISIYFGETNQHGQNWLYPLFLIIVITLAFYPFLMILSDPAITFAWDWSPKGWNLFCDSFTKNSHAIPQLFNPARRLSDLFDNTNSFSLHFLDGLHRIILAFFIFQIVSAFRKFVK